MAEKYIAASVLLERLHEARKRAPIVTPIIPDIDSQFQDRLITFSDLDQLIDELPAADVKEIWRCDRDRVRDLLTENIERAGDELTALWTNSHVGDDSDKAIAYLAILCNLADQITKRDKYLFDTFQ